jgi:carboxypeptidase family protein
MWLARDMRSVVSDLTFHCVRQLAIALAAHVLLFGQSQMFRNIARRCALYVVMSLLAACGSASDSPTAPSSTVVTQPPPTTGIVQGFVRLEAYFGLVFSPEAPLSGAQVLVTEGAGAGQSVTTASNGMYRLELPPGPFRLRWSAQGVESRDSDPGAVTAGATTTVNTVVLPRSFEGNPEWSVSGIVRDNRGNPVADAEVDAWDGVSWYAGSAKTDSTGHYRIDSKRPHPAWLHLTAYKAPYPEQYITLFCGASCALMVDFRLEGHVREWLDGPSAMRVGDVATVFLVGEYADGTRSVERAEIITTNPGVLDVIPWPASPPPYDKTYVKAIAPGTATLKQFHGSAVLTLNIQVFR